MRRRGSNTSQKILIAKTTAIQPKTNRTNERRLFVCSNANQAAARKWLTNKAFCGGVRCVRMVSTFLASDTAKMQMRPRQRQSGRALHAASEMNTTQGTAWTASDPPNATNSWDHTKLIVKTKHANQLKLFELECLHESKQSARAKRKPAQCHTLSDEREMDGNSH